jgi:hypothetical protein
MNGPYHQSSSQNNRRHFAWEMWGGYFLLHNLCNKIETVNQPPHRPRLLICKPPRPIRPIISPCLDCRKPIRIHRISRKNLVRCSRENKINPCPIKRLSKCTRLPREIWSRLQPPNLSNHSPEFGRGGDLSVAVKGEDFVSYCHGVWDLARRWSPTCR